MTTPQLVEAHRPRFVLLENVTGLLNSNGGADFRLIIERFAALGYGVAWRVMNSRYFGTPQSRPRVFIVASLGGVESAARSLFEKEGSSNPRGGRSDFVEPSALCDEYPVVPRLAFCLSATSARHTGMDWARSYVSYYDRVRRLTPTECEGLQTFPRGWTIPRPDESPAPLDLDTPRYHALGNAVTVSVVRWIARRLHAECSHPVQLSINTKNDETSYLRKNAVNPALADISSEVVKLGLSQDCKSTQNHSRWQNGGVAFGRSCVQTKVGPAPNILMVSDFGQVIEEVEPDDRYFISSNAAEGILDRVSRRGRTLFPPLQEALERLSGRDVQAASFDGYEVASAA